MLPDNLELPIEDAYHKMALIVSLHGRKYLPHFMRMQELYEAHKAQEQLFSLACELAISKTQNE